jgi:hypothetical protein
MGYVHDTAMSQFIPPEACQYTVGTFTDGVASNVWSKDKAAADDTSVIKIPVAIPQNSAAQKGGYLRSIDIWFAVTTAALDALAATIYKATLPADGAAFGAPASQVFSYDSGHDTEAERIDVDEHKMTLTLTTPFWLDDDDEFYVELSVDAALTSVFKFYGARANFTLRI